MRAALSRMANRDHQIRIVQGDTVILASSLIPGQRERGLPRHQRPHPLGRQRRPQGQRQGARLRPRLRGRAAVLLQHLQAAEPDAGPRRMAPSARQRRARRPHRRAGTDRIVIADEIVVDLIEAEAKISGKVQAGYVYVDGLSVGDVGEPALKDRKILGDEGIISVSVVIDSSTAGSGRPAHPRARFGHRRLRLRGRHPEGHGGPGALGPGRRGRAPPDAATHPPHAGQVGLGQLPPPSDDPAGRRRGLTPRTRDCRSGAPRFHRGGYRLR